MALSRGFAAIRSSVLSKIHLDNSCQATAASLNIFSRSFAEGTYLSKDNVTERILNVVKNFDKVDPAKVGQN